MKRIFALLFCVALIAACGKPDPDILPDIPLAPEPTPEPPPKPEPNITYVKKPTFSATDSHTQAAQLAADIVRVFALGSGMGENTSFKNTTRDAILEELDTPYAPTQGAWLSSRVYTSGAPKLVIQSANLLYPTNWETWRWLPASVDRRTTLPAATQAIIAEIFAAELLGDSTKLAERYDGALLSVAASQQMEHLLFNARIGNTYVDLDETGKPIEQEFTLLSQVRALHAIGRVALLTDAESYYGSLKRKAAAGYADQLFNQILAQHRRDAALYRELSPSGLRETIEAYAVFAAVTENAKWQLLAISHIKQLAALLNGKIGAGGLVTRGNETELRAQAVTVTGMLYAYRATGDDAYKSAAAEAWEGMQRLWDADARLFKPSRDAPTYSYTPALIAEVLHAFNGAAHILELDVQEQFATFFGNAVLRSGMVPAEYGREIDTIPDATENLRAPTFLSTIEYDPAAKQWTVTNAAAVTSQSMALAAAVLQGTEDTDGEYRIADFGMPAPAVLDDGS